MNFSSTCPSSNTESTDESTFLTPDGHLDWDYHRIGWAVSGVSALIATCISIALIIQHLKHYRNSEQQRYIVRICLLVPIYAIISFFSYRYFREAVYYQTIRDCYEAFVIASFFILLVQFVGEENVQMHTRKKPRMKFLFPLNCFTYDPSNPYFLQFLKWGILQYVVIRPTATVIAVVLQTQDKFCSESYSPQFGHFYFTIINFISVTIAMYCLLLFYFCMHEELEPNKPFYKFLCVKLVIFFSFWQQVLLGVLAHFNIIKATEFWTTTNVSTGLQAIAIDIEMIFFALLHLKGFPYAPYRDDKNLFDHDGHPIPERTDSLAALVDALNPIDIFREIIAGIFTMLEMLTGRKRKTEHGEKDRFDLQRAVTARDMTPLLERKEASHISNVSNA